MYLLKMLSIKAYGTYIDGSTIFKDKDGFYIFQWDNNKKYKFKKYLENWDKVLDVENYF